MTTTNQCANSYMAPPAAATPALPPGMTASQAGQLVWEQQQIAAKKAAANAAGNTTIARACATRWVTALAPTLTIAG
jgi:hypothetical protein